MDSIRIDNLQSSRLFKTIVILIVFTALHASSIYSYLLFHSLAELFSIMIAFALFVVSWNTRGYTTEPNLLFLGIAYLFVGILDLFHTLSYKGMNIFIDYPFYANQLWVGARYMESLSLLVFVCLSRERCNLSDTLARPIRRPPATQLAVVYSTISGLILLSIFYWKIFPICFVQIDQDGKGYQTIFKIVSGYIVILILAMAAWLMARWRDSFPPYVYRMLMWSLGATMGSEFCFTLYISNYGVANQIGHYLKIISFYMIYSSIIATGLRDPLQVIFRKLIESRGQLVMAKERAEAASQSKSTFLANMSHEIRTPLNAVLGFASLLEKTVSDPVSKSYLNAINLSGRSLMTIVNDILDLSKIEAGKMEIRYRPVSIRALFTEIKSVFFLKCDEKKLEFRIEIAPEVSPLLSTIISSDGKMGMENSHEEIAVKDEISVAQQEERSHRCNGSSHDLQVYFMMDEVRLRQILFNLVGNAVKFTDRGYILLTAECSSCSGDRAISGRYVGQFSEDENGYAGDAESFTGDDEVAELHISVADTGIGISDEFIKELFTPFSQQDSDLTRKYGGTGLGLAITRRLVEMMGGTITAKSQSGSGSLFKIVFPHVRVRRLNKNIQASLINHDLSESEEPEGSRPAPAMRHHDAVEAPTSPDSLAILSSSPENLQILIDLLHREVLSEWKIVREMQHMPDIESFARRVSSLGEAHNIISLTQFGKELLICVNAFDINRIESVLRSFPDLIQVVENMGETRELQLRRERLQQKDEVL